VTGPLDGIKVVELGVVIAGPATASLLADWGADVIKIEPLTGDPQRGNLDTSLFAMDNRSKRSMTVDLSRPEGLQIAHELILHADVFVTNLRPGALGRLGLDHGTLSAVHPRLVYAAITGYGDSPEGADKPGYDVGAFWARSGIGYALTRKASDPPVPRPGMGDHTTALAAAGGVAAALLARERTGQGQLVTTSLMRAGAYVLSSDLNSSLQGNHRPGGLRRMMFNPLLAVYRSSDGQWFWLLGVQATRHWPGLCRAIGRPELARDERFATLEALIENRDEVVRTLDAAFATRTLADWADTFAEHDVWWDPQLSFTDVLADPLVRAGGVVTALADGGETIATPVDFGAAGRGALRRTPEAGEHTELILTELGYDWDRIIALKDNKTIG
jgi:crotonobetainyl-CoA:carnitine CoA-transferase CaiB-like acyl-CoA transferase